MNKILVVDDDADIRRAFRRSLEGDDLTIAEASDGPSAIHQVAAMQPELVLMDVRMGATNGLDTLKKLRELNPKLLIIMMTAYGTTQTAIEAMKLGAYDYVLKPLDVPKLKVLIAAALKTAKDMREVVSYQPLLAKEDYSEGIVGKSETMQQVFKMIGQISNSEATVLITGESGTGKELVARAIYHHSPRKTQPFLAINCAAIPENLLESELFGHEKGSFTGAAEKRIGKFEQCDRGTLFLDEIGDMPLSTQTKILRVLQNGEFQRVGGNQTITVDVRIIAATNKAPERQVAEKKFREDLYYRLNVVRVHLPPLRDRLDDLPVLVDYFLQKLAKNVPSSARGKRIAVPALRLLEKYGWPGNVRELENIIERAAVVSRGDHIVVEDLPAEVREPRLAATTPLDLNAALDAAVGPLLALARRDKSLKVIPLMERELIIRVLSETGGNQVQSAKLLGITRATLRKRIEKFGILRRLEVK